MTSSIQPVHPQPIQQLQPKNARDDSIELGRYLAFLYDYRWLIIGVTLAAILLGGLYLTSARRIYEADILIQLDDSARSAAGAPKNLQSDLATVFDIRTATASEMEVLRSRTVVSRAVDDTRFYIDARPRYFPLVGAWLARHGGMPAPPAWFGLDTYAWGGEKANVSRFDVPREMEGEPFTLTAMDNGRYRLTQDDQGIDLIGHTGETLTAPGGELRLQVDALDARPGVEFSLSRANRLATVKSVQEHLKIGENRKDSGIIEVSLEGPDRRSTSGILNAIGDEYVRQNVERKSEKARKSLAFLDRQLPDLERRLEHSEERYMDFRNKHHTFNLGNEAKAMLDRTVAIQGRLSELDQKRAELLVRFADTHPSVEEIKRQKSLLSRQLAGLEARIQALPELEQDVLRLERDVKINTDLYTTLLATAQQLRLATSSEVGNAHLLDVAEAPVKPVRPRPALVLLLSALTGLFFGVAAAFVKKNLYGRIDDPQEVEDYLGLPVSATLPFSESQEKLCAQAQATAGKLPMLPFDAPGDPAIESLRRLRTALQYAMRGAPSNIVMVTGPTPSVGKSFVSANFATVLASFGNRVLLIDGDLRAGNLHRYFGVERGAGLAEAIADPQLLEKIIHRNQASKVDFLSTGTLPDKPGELLAQGSLGTLLQHCAARYDLVLIDTAPVLAVSDALVLAAHAGAILNVVRGGVSTLGEVEESVKQLNQAGRTVTGVVFNDQKVRLSRYGYASNYGRYRLVEGKR